jgi:Ca2+-transporting ATPase
VQEGHSEGEVRAITFSALIIGNIFLILADLSKTRSFVAVIKERSTITLLILSGAFGLLLLAIAVPALHLIFNFEHPGYAHFLPAITSAAVMLMILEIIKWRKYGRTVRL